MKSKNIFSIVLAILTVVCAISLFACSQVEMSKSEKFDYAKKALDNYVVDVEIKYSEGDNWYATLYVAGENGKIKYFSSSNPNDVTTQIYTETEGSESIEKKFDLYDGDVGIFQLLLSGDFDEKDGWYVCSEKGLEYLSNKSLGTIDSGKIKFEDNKFSYAEFMMTIHGSRCEIFYHFYDYGKTNWAWLM